MHVGPWWHWIRGPHGSPAWPARCFHCGAEYEGGWADSPRERHPNSALFSLCLVQPVQRDRNFQTERENGKTFKGHR